MKTPLALPKISSADILQAMGLERRRSTSGRVARGLSLIAVGALLGAAAVVVRALIVGHDRAPDLANGVTEFDPATAA
jgi:ABC-type lipoprotein release transport system permease subunit